MKWIKWSPLLVPLVYASWWAVVAAREPSGPYFLATGNPIPETSGQSPLQKPNGRYARYAALVTPTPFTEALQRTRAALEASFGGVDEEPRSPFFDAPFGEAQFVICATPAYNRSASYEGYSQLRVIVVNGERLLDHAGTLLCVERTDHWRTWGRDFHTGLRVPFKLWTYTNVVTDAEMHLLSRAVSGLPSRVVVSNKDYGPWGDERLLEELRRPLQVSDAG